LLKTQRTLPLTEKGRRYRTHIYPFFSHFYNLSGQADSSSKVFMDRFIRCPANSFKALITTITTLTVWSCPWP